MFGLLTKWLTSTGGSAPLRSARLTLQPLEPREVPAVNAWLGYSNSFIDPANWSLLRLPQAGDQLEFAGPYSPPPSPPPPPGTVVSPPPSGGGSNTSTTFAKGLVYPPVPNAPVTLPDTYAGIRIIDGYSGTLTIPFNIEFGTYDQQSGNTNTPGTDVTVTGGFSWTGGNANTSNVLGVYHIQAPMGILGTDTSNISSGSKISVEPNGGGLGSSVQGRGILSLLNTAGIEVAVGCLLQVNGNGNGNAKHNMQAGATEVVKGMAIYCGVEINNGALIIDGNVKVGHDGTVGSLKVTGQVSPGTIGSPSVYIRQGNLHLLNQERVTVSHTVELLHGEIRTLTRAGVADDQQVAYIEGVLIQRAGSVILGDAINNVAPASYSKLHVTEQAYLLGGTFHVKLDSQDEGAVDRIITSGDMMVGGSYQITPSPTSLPLKAQKKWVILFAEEGFVDDSNGTPTPGFTLGRRADGKAVELW